ncbi:ABC transporter permease [Spiroplasma endosymbiont of Dioctria linearis]|uniref:ABC transporter permease n=1 Tax=Spiroplasma endosymbiont of Dioctria linearis TaxID=3066290 RepID=UPI00313AE2C8
MRKVIPGIWIVKFSFKLIIKERSFLIFNGLYILFSLFIAIYSIIQKNISNFLMIFDYYVLLTIFVILFIICLRLTQYFYVAKRDDKTMNIIVTQQLSRKKLFAYQFIAFILLIFINLFISFLLINIINMLFLLEINLFLLRITLTYLIYSFISCVFLISFFLLISLFTNIQVSTIVATLILASTFISNLPYTFLIQGEESKNISLSYKGKNTVFSVNEVYDSYDLKKHVLNKQMKYPNLGFAIYENFINNKYETDPNSLVNNFDSEKNIQERIEFWKKIGIVEEKNQIVDFKTPTKIIAANSSSKISKWKGDEISFRFELKYRFLSIEELKNKISNSSDEIDKKNLEEFINFTEYITSKFSDFQNKFYNLFDTFILLNDQENIEKNYIKNITKPEEENILFDSKNLLDIYQSYFSYSNNKLILENSKIKSLVEEDLFFPTMLSARILENYFIRYTNNMVIFENSTVIKNENWNRYSKSRKVYNIFFQLNFISNMMQNYAYYGGRNYEDMWFESESSSKIIFNKQDNLFMAKPTYTFKLNSENKIETNTYENFIEPYFYILLQLAISVINYYVAKFKFKKLDLGG